MATIGTRLMTWFRGKRVGQDQFGNRYFRGPARSGYQRAGYRRERRWVIYDGEDEASRVPPAWHAWLHHMVDEVPSNDPPVHPWQQEHQPNQTGTPAAYHPPGSVLAGGKRPRATGDYQAWTPPRESS